MDPLPQWTCSCGAQSLSGSRLGFHTDQEGAVAGAVSQLCSWRFEQHIFMAPTLIKQGEFFYMLYTEIRYIDNK